MTGEKLFTASFSQLLLAREPDLDAIRNAVINAYNAEHGTCLPASVDPLGADGEAVRVWLNKADMENPDATFFVRHPTLVGVFYPSLSEKISRIGQFHCLLCRSAGPIYMMPIRIAPISYQSADSTKKTAFKKAIAHRFKSRPDVLFERGKRLCVHIVFVLGNHRHVKDADNMAKIFNDSLQDVLYDNDEQIDHLSLVKVQWRGSEEFIIVNLRESHIQGTDDVWSPVLTHGWAGAEELKLEDFM